MTPTSLTLAERIEARSILEDRGYATPCRAWKGTRTTAGYGSVGTGSTLDGSRRMVLVHRAVYELHHGPIPAGLEIDHLCSQRDCCEHTHLEAVTRAENVRRSESPRLTRERHAAITHCPQGHEYTPENTRLNISHEKWVRRGCRLCARDANRRWREARRRRPVPEQEAHASCQPTASTATPSSSPSPPS